MGTRSPERMIYWDHNAGTPLRPEVARLLRDALEEELASGASAGANPSSVHGAGRKARARLDAARARVARVLGCEPREVVFTGSGSESDALALKGAYRARTAPGRPRLVTSSIEHPALLAAVAQLESDGAPVVRVAPTGTGEVPLAAIEAQLGPDVALCSLMWANNETGVVQPVREVARLCRERGVLFHTDAVQAAGKVPCHLREVDADLLSLSAHKFGGPPGCGVLVVRRGVNVWPLVPGHQENGRRAGSPNVLLAEATALALERAAAESESAEAARIRALRDDFERALRQRIPGVTVHGADAPARLGNTSNVRFEDADGEALLIALDLEGICVSSGAACASGSLKPSHVLLAMGLSARDAHATLRFSLGSTTTGAEVEQVVAALVRHVPHAREAARSTAR